MPTTHQRRLAPARPDNHRIGMAGGARQGPPERCIAKLGSAGVAMSGTARTSKPSNSHAGSALLGRAERRTLMHGRHGDAVPSAEARSGEMHGRHVVAMTGMPKRDMAGKARLGMERQHGAMTCPAWQAVLGKALKRLDQHAIAQTAAGERGINSLHFSKS